MKCVHRDQCNGYVNDLSTCVKKKQVDNRMDTFKYQW